MYILLNVISILYFVINLIVPTTYIRILIKLRKSLLEFNSNKNHYKQQEDNSINSNINTHISPRNSSNSLDIIDKK